jgi:hypothetical protein
MLNKLQHGEPFSETTTHATAAVATHAAATGKTYYITNVSVSSDKAGAILLIKQGTTTIWQMQIGATAHSIIFSAPLKGASGALVSAEIDGTSACKANIAGFEL